MYQSETWRQRENRLQEEKRAEQLENMNKGFAMAKMIIIFFIALYIEYS